MDWTCTLPGPRNTTPSLFAIIYLVPPGWYEVQLMNQRCDLARADEVEQLEEFTGRCSRPTHLFEMGNDLRSTLECRTRDREDRHKYCEATRVSRAAVGLESEATEMNS